MMVSDIVKGYGELLSKNVMHRDLKLANVFINDNCHKIGDFGFATTINDCNEKIRSGLVGMI